MKELAIRFFDNRCFVTHEKFTGRNMTIHHLWYIEDDVRRENYPNGEKGRLAYLKDLRPKIEHMPFRFILIKNGIHTRIDHFRTGLSRMKRDNFMRLVLAVLMTRKEPRIIKKKHYKRYKK
jgi:hypothetical protein